MSGPLERWRSTPAEQRYAVAVAVAGGVLLTIVAASGRVSLRNAGWGQFWLLVLFVVVGEFWPIKLPRRGGAEEELSTAPAFAFALMMLSGTAAALLALALAELASYFLRGKSLLRSVFDVGHYTLALGAAGAILEIVGRVPRTDAPPFFVTSDLPLILVAGTLFFVGSTALAGTRVALARSAPLLDHLKRDLLFRAGTVGVALALAPLIVVGATHSLPLLVLMFLPIVALYRGGRHAAVSEYQALHDTLTKLPNRVLLQDRLSQAILAGGRDGSTTALMLMDLDRFKEVNDTLGHQTGDELLMEIGPRLRSVLRESDTIARLGGDEFAIVLTQVVDRAHVARVADKIKRAISLPFNIEGFRLGVEASIGIAFAPEDGEDVDSLLQRADVAMYVAKASKSGYAFYSAEHDRHSPQRLALVGDMREALQTDQIELFYQPKAELMTGAIRGVEALVRWNHHQLGLMNPDRFMPLTEHTGLIEPLTRYVLDAALRQVRQWLDAGIELVVSVNVSARSLVDHGLPDEIADLLSRHNLDPRWLRLEVTESAVMDDPVRALAILDRLSEAGIGIALDDFGTGYSSLAYLKRLPVCELKIDKTFVTNMHSDEDDAVIVHSTIDLGRNLGLEVVAEGVETEQHWNRLAELGCTFAQGYYLSPPVAAGDFVQWMRGREGRLRAADELHS